MKNLIDTRLRNVYLKPGEIYVSSTPAFVSTILGSCVSVVIHSPEAGAGAICHALLPSGSLEDGFRYVDSTVHYIFEKLRAITGQTGGFEAKLFGGADMLLLSQNKAATLSIGQQNIQAAHEALEKLGLTLTASDTSGQSGRKIFFNTRTGVVLMRHVKKTFW